MNTRNSIALLRRRSRTNEDWEKGNMYELSFDCSIYLQISWRHQEQHIFPSSMYRSYSYGGYVNETIDDDPTGWLLLAWLDSHPSSWMVLCFYEFLIKLIFLVYSFEVIRTYFFLPYFSLLLMECHFMLGLFFVIFYERDLFVAVWGWIWTDVIYYYIKI